MSILKLQTSEKLVTRRFSIRLTQDLSSRLDALREAVEKAGGEMRIEDGIAEYLGKQITAGERELERLTEATQQAAPNAVARADAIKPTDPAARFG